MGGCGEPKSVSFSVESSREVERRRPHHGACLHTRAVAFAEVEAEAEAESGTILHRCFLRRHIHRPIESPRTWLEFERRGG